MNIRIPRKNNVKYRSAIVLAIGFLLLTFSVQAAIVDTIPAAVVDSLAPVKLKRDSIIRVDTLKMSKDSVDAIIKYQAQDSGIMIISTKELFLYGKARTDYKDLNMEAATIRFDQQASLVKAYGSIDSTGNPLSKPQLTEGEMKTISDSIFYNLKTAKGLTKNTFLQEGEIFVNAGLLKKISATEIFAKNARFTTCNLDTPHFAFRAPKMKMINNKLAVTGRVYPEIESVPIPVVFLPFGLFPLNRARHSGVLFPAFTASEDFGLGLEGFGYYKVFGENLDLTAKANLYSYGGWTLNVNSKYIVRYRYTGSFNISFQNTKILNRSIGIKEEYAKSNSYMINWSHSRDARARPGTNLSANVNFGSTKYNQSLLNNPFQNFQNQLSSSINYSKDWRGKFNMSLSMNHNQNSVSRLVNMNLPTANFNVVTFYPFQKKDQVGSGKWYEKIGLGYSGNFQNQLSFYDSAFNFHKLLDTLQWGAAHSIPISLSLPQMGVFTISPTVSFEEHWFGQKINRVWNTNAKKVDTTITKGFYTARQMSFGLGINTRIFGTYKFSPKSNLIAIRHEIRPTISINYHPDFQKNNYYTTQVDSTGRKVRFSQFEGGVIGAFAEGAFGGIGFGVDNFLEMKIKDKNDTTIKGRTVGKKIKLIDGFGFNSSYNLMADSFALGNFTLYARSTLFEKINITASALLNPYEVDSKGYPVNRILFDPSHFKFGRITNGSISVSTAFTSKSKDGKSTKETDKEIPMDPFLTPDEQQRQLQFARANPAEFTDFNIPWTINLSYSLNFSRILNNDYSGYTTQTSSSVNFNGDFSLTPKWKIGGSGYYDFQNGGLQQFSTFISREMHCWQLSINVTPVGRYRSFNISFSPKSGILRDLKINRSRTFSNY